jgi:LPS-assembly protein
MAALHRAPLTPVPQPIETFDRSLRTSRRWLRRSLLATALAAALAPALAAAQECAPADYECRIDEQRYALCRVNRLLEFYVPGLPDASAREGSEATIDAEGFDLADRERITVEGDVEIGRADQLLRTQRLQYDSASGEYVVDTPVTYQDAGVLVAAQRGEGNIQAGTADFSGVRYQFLGSRGNGRAERVQILDPERSRMERMSFSTCDIDEPDWELRASRIDLDQETGVGKARNATLYFHDFPLLYLPYGEFPIDDRRKSGFLLPTIGSSNSGGFDFTLPYYLNLAPNYDMTLFPRIVGSRGYMLGAEFRYLFGPDHRGELFGTWLPDDKDYGDSRGYFEARHYSRLADQWWFDADIRQVSDDRYFEDFGDSLSIASTSLLPSRAGVYGRGRWWNAEVVLDAWKIVDPTVPPSAEPYRRLPRAVFDASEYIGLGLMAGVDSELVHFSKNEGSDSGTRLDVYPWLALPIERSGWFLRPELGWRQTEYEFDVANYGKRDESRGLPIFSLDSGLIFERETNLFGRDWLQTLEPRLFYLYVPYEDQSDIPVFDTQELTFGFGQLFRTNRFVGADRQADANQVTLAVTSRLIDDADGRERLTASFGQIRYFRPQRVQLGRNTAEADFAASAFVGEVGVRLSDDWYAAVGGQWNPETNATDVSSLRVQKQIGERGVVNFTYRHRRNSFRDETFVEQVDASALYALNERWRLVGRWNWSIKDAATLEALGGFEYESCCYAIRLLGRHYVRNTEGDRNNAIYLEIELKGLGSLGRRSEDLLRRAIVGYSRYGE